MMWIQRGASSPSGINSGGVESLERRQLLYSGAIDTALGAFASDNVAINTAVTAMPLAVAPPSVLTVLNNGPASNRIDISVVGDGFTQSQLSAYAADVQTFIKGFFNEAPLSSYKSFFNVHQVNVISSVSGVSNDPNEGTTRDTPLAMSFWTDGIERLLGVDTVAAKQYAQNAPGDDQTVAIANSTKYGGAGYPEDDVLTFAGGNASAVEIVKHEFGHAFGDLADEYDYGGPRVWPGGEPAQADVSTYTAAQMVAQKVKWWRWIGVQGVGTYEGADYSQKGIYRPTTDSKMRTLGIPYGPVNTEQLIEKMYETVHPIDSATAAGTYPANTSFFVKPLKPSDHADSVQWYLDGKAVSGATGVTFNPASLSLSAGKHTLSVKVEDMTTAVRDEGFRSAHMTGTDQWTISVGAPPKDTAPPVAGYQAGTLAAGNAVYRFNVTYTDNNAVKVSSIDSSDVQVTGPNGYSQLATLVSVSGSTDGTPRTAVYQIKAPGGTWDTPDNGPYTIKLRASQVSDTAGNFAAGRTLGTLAVAFANSTNLSGRVFYDVNGDGVQQSTETGMSGVRIFIDANHNGILDGSEPSTKTNASGDYAFMTLKANTFRVREVVPSGYRIDKPSSGYYDVTLVLGQQVSGRNFADTRQAPASGPPAPPSNSSAVPNPSDSSEALVTVLDDPRATSN